MSDTEALKQLPRPTSHLGYAALQRWEEEGFFRFPSKGYCYGNVAHLAAFARMSSASRTTIEQAASVH